MADEILQRDQNYIVVLGGITDDAAQEIRMFRIDPITKRLLVSATGLGSGTVTSISQGIGILLSTSPITTTGSVSLATALQPMVTLTGNSLKVLRVNAGETAVEYATLSAGTVTSVSVTTANGVSGTVATATTTPAITITLGAITPTSVNGLTITTTTGTLTITNGKTLTILKTISLTAADDTGVYTLPTGTKTLVATDVTTLSSLVSVGTITTGTWSATTIAVAKGGTGVITIAALSIWLANSLDTITSVTPGAGNSIRINAGGTAWEAFTPAAGGAGTVTSVGWTGGIVSVATATTTPAFTIAGTSGGIPYFSSATTWATSAALAASALVIGGGAAVAPSTITTGANVLTALGVAVGSAGAFVVNGGALGTPSSGTLTSATGYLFNNLTAPSGLTAITFAAGSETTFTYSATTQTGILQTSTTLTTGTIEKLSVTGSSAVASAASSGSLLTLTSATTGFTAATQRLGAIYSTGINGTASVVLQGLDISIANTGTTNTNQALRLSASGASTTNIALDLAAGELRLAGSAGTSGQIVTSAGVNATPTWTTPAAGGTTLTYTAQTGTYAILTSDQVVNATSGTFTATLPTAVGVTGKFYHIKNSGTGVVTIATTSSQTIDGATTLLLTQQYSSVMVVSNGANWIIT